MNLETLCYSRDIDFSLYFATVIGTFCGPSQSKYMRDTCFPVGIHSCQFVELKMWFWQSSLTNQPIFCPPRTPLVWEHSESPWSVETGVSLYYFFCGTLVSLSLFRRLLENSRLYFFAINIYSCPSGFERDYGPRKLVAQYLVLVSG